MSAPADLVRALDDLGLTAPAPTEHPIAGVAECRWVTPASLVEVVRRVKETGYFFESLTCIDRVDPHRVFELLYTFNCFEVPARIALRMWATKDDTVPTVSHLYGGASWNEREVWEFYGLKFADHPNLTWLLLPEGTEFHPLLKSFTAPPPSIYDDSMNAPVPSDDHRSPHG